MGTTAKKDLRSIIRFSENWNRKLNNYSFSTIRLENRSKYKKGKLFRIELFDVELKDYKFIGNAFLVASCAFTIGQISDTMSFIDANMTATNLKNMLSRMYYKKVNDIVTCRFNMLVLQFEKKV